MKIRRTLKEIYLKIKLKTSRQFHEITLKPLKTVFVDL